jgi:hypothetical protein
LRPRNVSVVGRTDDPAPVPEEGVGRVEASRRPASAFEDVGGHVAGVLRAAEEAAAQIRADADAYASDTRHAVDSYASQERRAAEEEARQTLAAAQAEARAVREAAEAMAHRLEEESQERRDRLRDELRVLEERRNRALDDLREIAAHLEDVLAGRPSASAPEPSSPSLVDALSLKRRR